MTTLLDPAPFRRHPHSEPPLSDATNTDNMSTDHRAHAPRLVQACYGLPLDRPPVWFMRQAGRYMPEYQAIRGQTTFLGLCKTVDLAVEVSLQPWQVFGVDAVIMFSDILIPPEAMGMTLDFTEQGPQFANPLQTPADLDQLHIPDPIQETGFVMEILRQLRQSLAGSPETALIGFAGAPWTLASYMIEGGTSKNHLRIKEWMYNHPQALHRLLGMLAETVTRYLQAQIEAGAQMVQLFDTWGGLLSRQQYETFVLPYHQQIIEALPSDRVPVTLYVKNSGHVLDLMQEARPTVISLDNQLSLSEARRLLGHTQALQGNLDNTILFASPDIIKPAVESMVIEGGYQGYIFNVNHGILPQTPTSSVQLVVDTVKAMTQTNP